MQFALIYLIMNIRIFGQYIQPVAESDPLYIAVFNRILMNNVEQGVIFFGLFSYLLFGVKFE